jgi:hypothetical protein
MKLNTIHLSVLAVAICSSLVYAESLKEKEQRKRENEILQAGAKTMNETCKSTIKAVGDWDTFKGALSNDQAQHVGLNCSYAVLESIQRLCDGSDEAKAAVRAGITTVRCQGGGDAEISIKNKVVTFKTKLGSEKTDVPKQVREYLKEKL